MDCSLSMLEAGSRFLYFVANGVAVLFFSPPAHTLVQLGVHPFLYFQAAMFTLSSFNSCHVCMASACSTGYTFPETKLITQAVLDSSLGCHGHRKYTPLFPLDNDFSLVLAQLENEAN